MLKSIRFHKRIAARKKTNTSVFKEDIVGFNIKFFSYAQLINLFEEIFIYQVYKFESDVSNPHIIDCGSNIGISVLYFKKLYPLANILCFEPDEATFGILKDNILTNNLQNISLFNIALSDKEEKTFLYKNSHLPGSLNMSLVESDEKLIIQPTSTKKLSAYINHPIHLIKIDVEGSEIKIINDLSTNSRKIVIHKIIIEYHPNITKIPVAEFCAKIENIGFMCHCFKDSLHSGATEIIVHGTARSD